jgi:hypothetical protein
MKTKTIYALMGIVTMLSVARVDAATIFAPTDPNVNFLLADLSGGGILALFDDSDQAYAGASLIIDAPGIINFAGPLSGGNYIAVNSSAATLTLTGNNHFILGLSFDGGTSWLADTSVVSLGANAYRVFFDSNSVVQVDVQVIPVPAAVWLFGSGILGLVAVARRKASL